jgi:hypothetical protein
VRCGIDVRNGDGDDGALAILNAVTDEDIQAVMKVLDDNQVEADVVDKSGLEIRSSRFRFPKEFKQSRPTEELTPLLP